MSGGLSSCGERHHSFATTSFGMAMSSIGSASRSPRRLQRLSVGNLQPAVLGLPFVERRARYPVLAADISGRRTRPHLVGNPYYLPKRLLIRQNGFGIPKQLICIWLYSSLIGYEPLTSPGENDARRASRCSFLLCGRLIATSSMSVTGSITSARPGEPCGKPAVSGTTLEDATVSAFVSAFTVLHCAGRTRACGGGRTREARAALHRDLAGTCGGCSTGAL